MKITAFVLILIFLSACTQKNPNPEQSDPIYKDLKVELDIATKALEDEQKNMLSLEKEKDQAVPQTGQIKYAMKKIYDSEHKIDMLKQQKLYFEIKVEERAQQARRAYEESLKPGAKPWPDPKEIEEYEAIERLQRAKFDWDRNKGMKKAVPRGTDKKPAPPAEEGRE